MGPGDGVARGFILVPFGPARRHIIRFVQGGGSGAAQDADPIGEGFDEQHENHDGKQGGDGGVEARVENQAVGVGDARGGNRARRRFARRDVRACARNPSAGLGLKIFW